MNIKGMYQITPLHDAVINGHYKVCDAFVCKANTKFYEY